MTIHDFLDRLLSACATYASGVCGACADQD